MKAPRFSKPVDTQSEIDAAKKTLAKTAERKAEKKTMDKAETIESPMFVALETTLLPLLNILDGIQTDLYEEQTADGTIIRARPTRAEADHSTGTDLPSQRDMGLRIFLGQIIQTTVNQLYGYTTQAGKKIDGALAFLSEAEYRVNSPQFLNRVEQGTLSDNDMKAWHYFEINETRVAAMTEYLRAHKAIYRQITGEDWKPYERTAAKAPVQSPDAIKAKIATRFGKTAN